MKMALKDGQVFIKEANNNQFMVIKSWSKMRWSKQDQMLYGPADIEILNKLADLVPLPKPFEQLRTKLNRIAKAVDAERLNEEPKPLYKYPVKKTLYKHQMRGANMALMVFELIAPEKEEVNNSNGE